MTRPLCILLLALATLTVPSLAVQAAASGGPTLAYPPAPYSWRDVDHLNETLALHPSYVLGLDPVVQRSYTHTSPDRVDVNVGTRSGAQWTFTQTVDGVVGGSGDTYWVALAHLQSGVEVDRDEGGLLLVGPIPKERLTGSTQADHAEQVATLVGLPASGPSAWTVTKLADSSAPNVPVRLATSLGWPPGFVLQCPDCLVAVRREAGVDGNLNLATAVFAPNGDLVTFETTRWIDFAANHVLSKADAQDQAMTQLRDQGFAPTNVTVQGTGYDSNANRITYHLAFGQTSGRGMFVTQDAITGKLIGAPFGVADSGAHPTTSPTAPTSDPSPAPAVSSSPAVTENTRAVPDLGMGAVVLAAVAVALLSRHR